MRELSAPDNSHTTQRDSTRALAAKVVGSAVPVVAPTVAADTVAAAVIAAVAMIMTVSSLAGWGISRPKFVVVGWSVVAAAVRGPWVEQLATAVVVLETGRFVRGVLGRWIDRLDLAVAWLGCLSAAAALMPPVRAVAVLVVNVAVWLAVPAVGICLVRTRVRR